MSKKEKEVKKPSKRPIPTWEDITDQVYSKIMWYATRFIILSIVGVVVGFIAIIYGILAMYFVGPTMLTLIPNASPLQDFSVFLGVFIGVGAITASIVLLVWGLFWRRKVDNRSIF
jgi:hypothetical protein